MIAECETKEYAKAITSLQNDVKSLLSHIEAIESREIEILTGAVGESIDEQVAKKLVSYIKATAEGAGRCGHNRIDWERD